MRDENEVIATLKVAVKESVAHAKATRDFNRARRFQQLWDDIDAGRVTILYGDPAKKASGANDTVGD